MSVIPPLGALSLGVVIGFLVRIFVRRFQEFTPQTLGSVVSILAGGALVKFLEAEPATWWFYPIGLLLGFIVYTLMGVWILGPPRPGRRDVRTPGNLLDLPIAQPPRTEGTSTCSGSQQSSGLSLESSPLEDGGSKKASSGGGSVHLGVLLGGSNPSKSGGQYS